MDPQLAPGDDPLGQLENWGRRADRRARRRHAARRLWRTVTWPVRVLRRGRREQRRRLGLVLCLGMVAAIGVAYVFGPQGPLHHQPAPRPYTTAAASGSTPGRPFDATPAEHWAEGATGIMMPPAETVNGFSATTVATDLETVHSALVAARLDPRMLVSHDPSALVSLFAQSSRSTFAKLLQDHQLPVVTLLDTNAQLGAYPPRVSGDTAFTVSRNRDGMLVLDIQTNYVWAYAFDSGRVAVIHDVVDWFFFRSEDVDPAGAGLAGLGLTFYALDADCALLNGQGLLAPAPTGPSDPLAYWSPAQDILTRTSCSLTSTVDSSPTVHA